MAPALSIISDSKVTQSINSPAATETFKDSSPGGSCRPGRMVRRSWQEACTARDRPEPSFPAEQGGQRVTEAPAGQAGTQEACISAKSRDIYLPSTRRVLLQYLWEFKMF